MLDLLIALLVQTAPRPAPDPCNAAAVPLPRGCPAWRLVQPVTEGDVFVDPASLNRHGDSFEITLRAVFGTARFNRMRSAVSHIRFDCAGRSATRLRTIQYDEAGVRISDTAERGAPPLPMEVGDHSPNAAILTEYCRR